MYKEIGKPYALTFAYLSFPSLEWLAFELRFYLLNRRKKESLGAAWAHFNDLINSDPNLAIQDHILLQHFYMGLSVESA